MTRTRALRLAAIVIAPFLFTFAAPASAAPEPQGPSFSCKAPAPLEAVICGDAELSARDRDLAALFAEARSGLVGSAPSNELAEQRRWLAILNKWCPTETGGPRKCLLGYYDDRVFHLAVAILFKDHDRAMGEIRRVTPKLAPLYDAIYLYATVDDPAPRRAAVTPLIAPEFTDLRMIPEQMFQGQKIPARPEQLLEPIASPADAASSDKNFATFLVVASTHGYPGGNPLPLPCAALVRRPGLWMAADPHYGGAIDGLTPTTDCAATLPPTPHFDALVAAATKAQPACEGTIRFSLGASYSRRVAQLRLGLAEPDGSDGDEDQPKAIAKFMRTHQAAVRGAVTDLTMAYATLPRDPKRLTPDAAVRAAVLGAFNLCE